MTNKRQILKTDTQGNVVDYIDGKYRKMRRVDDDGTVYWVRTNLETGAIHRMDFDLDTQTWGEYKPICGVVLIEGEEREEEVLQVIEEGKDSIIVDLPTSDSGLDRLQEIVEKYVTE
jgi:hypothetical protein